MNSYNHTQPAGRESGGVLHIDLRDHTERLVDHIAGPAVDRITVVDGLLDLRNLGNGEDLGLELTVDEMLESVPAGSEISAEWWLSCLATLTDHATFLAAGYPSISPKHESIAA